MINWEEIKHFKKHEFPEDPDIYADPRLIRNLDEYRELLGQKVHPSPVEGALARLDDKAKSSQHYAVDRKSTAIDVFPEGSIINAWTVALTSGFWAGIGVYFDTQYTGKDWCMLHLDIREKPLIWYRINGDYFYPLHSDPLLRRLMRLLIQRI